MLIYSETDRGKLRQTNQDSLYTGSLKDGALFALVCDGMGGANAGNVASECAVKAISGYVNRSYRSSMDITAVERMLKGAITSANIELYDMSMKNSELNGMGTTAVAVFVRGSDAVIAHVGDSRAYLVNDTITQLTRDHSVVQALVESGRLTPEEAKVHPRKNVITRALGAEGDILPDITAVTLSPNDSLLLCSDGLTNYVDPPDILAVFRECDIAAVAQRLVAKANENGGGDNITTVTITNEL